MSWAHGYRRPAADRLPSLSGIRSFAAAGRHLNLTAAAEELGVTQGAVSRAVQALEAELGMPLFRRAGRGIELTPAGAAYHARVTDALAQIAAATRALRRPEREGILSLSVLPTFALRWLVPRLPRFHVRHPDIQVDLSASEETVDFGADPIDLALRNGTGSWPGAEATLLMNETVGVFCAPELLRRRGAIAGPADLRDHRLLVHTTRPAAWAEYFASLGLAPPDVSGSPGFEHFFMLAEAAAAGMGLALLPLFLTRGDVAAGRLVQPLDHTMRPATAYYLLHAPGQGSIRKIRLFRDWLIAEVAEAEAI
ncbi:transcriptional regulator GcvA [Inquilinus limosus]|uniref:transcriptional regulator GcvA n=1 Tax=Inquilinus limosus TaxID=171674 RepID=UPI0004078E97|nr:transcriptional regulator GcvA [Inquilinus limosus]